MCKNVLLDICFSEDLLCFLIYSEATCLSRILFFHQTEEATLSCRIKIHSKSAHVAVWKSSLARRHTWINMKLLAKMLIWNVCLMIEWTAEWPWNLVNTNLVIMPSLLMIGGGKDPGYQRGQIPWGFNESYRHSAHIGSLSGSGPLWWKYGWGWRLFNLVILLLLLGSHSLLFISKIAFSSEWKVTEDCIFLITSKANKGSLKQSLTLCVCVWVNEKKETQSALASEQVKEEGESCLWLQSIRSLQ